MRRTSTSFQPYDRATGVELSPQQQEACQSNYAIIKAYIDAVEGDTDTPLPWSRKKLRCSTTELLDSIDSLASNIRQRQHSGTTTDHDADSPANSAEAPGEQSAAMGFGTETTQFYQQAVNLLHELVSRLADVGGMPGEYLAPEMLEAPRISPASFIPGSADNSSEASATFSSVAASRTSYITSGSTRTGSSMTSNEVIAPEEPQSPEQLELSNEVVFDASPEETVANKSAAYEESKKQVMNDWVLEYLRGGWLANSPVTAAEHTVSPVFPMAEDTSPTGSFGPPRRIDSDEVSIDWEDYHSRRNKSLSSTGRMAKRGRPIPTMASRFMGKAGYEDWQGPDVRSSTASGYEHFKTPKSIMSGGTVFHTPEATPGSHPPVTRVT